MNPTPRLYVPPCPFCSKRVVVEISSYQMGQSIKTLMPSLVVDGTYVNRHQQAFSNMQSFAVVITPESEFETVMHKSAITM